MKKFNVEEKQSIWSKFLAGISSRRDFQNQPTLPTAKTRALRSPKLPNREEQPPRFALVSDRSIPDQYFDRLRMLIFRRLDVLRETEGFSKLRQPVMFREVGRVSDNRAYFFLKEPGETGWLFERAGNGWVISRSEKIYGAGTFIRRTDAWDIVNLFAPSSGEGAVRVTSQRMGGEMISFFVYESKILFSLGLSSDKEKMEA